jgi:hypothetical protein
MVAPTLRFWSVCACASLSASSTAFGAYSQHPIPAPFITIDEFSPSVLSGDFTPADVLEAPPPNVAIPPSFLGITPLDDLNSFSFGAGPMPGETFGVLFSVNRGQFSGEAPDPVLADLGYIYNAFQQAELNQAASDMFLGTALFDLDGQVPGKAFPDPDNNVLARDGADAGGTDFGLAPHDVDVDDPSSGPQDNVNGMGNGPGTLGASFGVIHFTLKTGSPSLTTFLGIGGSESGADIYLVRQDQPGVVDVYAIAEQLGLMPGDDIVSMIVVRQPGKDGKYRSQFGPGDRVIFSLSPNSPTLDVTPLDASDLIASDFPGVLSKWADGNELGLEGDAVLSALTFIPTEDIQQLVLDAGIRIGVPGDLDGDGDVDLSDLGILLASFGVDDGGDINGDGVTDLADLGILLSNYGYTP